MRDTWIENTNFQTALYFNFSTSKAHAVDMNRDDVGFFEMVEGFFDRAAGIMEDQLVSEVIRETA